jgi:uncharacterized protein YggE
MRNSIMIVLVLTAGWSGLCSAQVSGNAAFSETGGKAKALQNERSKQELTEHELPPSRTSMFLEANVLMNIKADEYIAIFGVAQEGETPAQCSQKMDATILELTEALKQLGVRQEDLFVDFVAQNKIYGYEVVGDIAREKLVGFELKKNVHIHYQDKLLLDKFVLAAARLQIFDLVKVDYIIRDIAVVHDRLMEEASRVMKRKIARNENLLGIKLQPPAQVYAEKAAMYFPTEMYDSYRAFESEVIDATRQRYTVQGTRKGRTFYFNGLDANGFDEVINPVAIEPVIQCTLFLKVKYEVEQTRAK